MRDPKTGRQREKEQRVQGTIADAVRVREELRDELRAESLAEPGAHVVKRPPTSETLSDYAKRWLVHLHRTGRNRRHVIEGKVSILERFILPYFGDFDVHDVGRADLGAWMEWLGTLRTNDQPYAKETLAGAWRVVRTMFRDALMLADLERDPTEGVRFRVKGAGRGSAHLHFASMAATWSATSTTRARSSSSTRPQRWATSTQAIHSLAEAFA
jgi:hypothetical protein